MENLLQKFRLTLVGVFGSMEKQELEGGNGQRTRKTETNFVNETTYTMVECKDQT